MKVPVAFAEVYPEALTVAETAWIPRGAAPLFGNPNKGLTLKFSEPRTPPPLGVHARLTLGGGDQFLTEPFRVSDAVRPGAERLGNDRPVVLLSHQHDVRGPGGLTALGADCDSLVLQHALQPIRSGLGSRVSPPR